MRIAVNARLLVGQEYSGVHLYVYNVLCELLICRPDDDFLLVTDRAGQLPELPRAVERVTVGPPARHPVLFVAWFEWSLPRAVAKWQADVLVSFENLGSLRAKLPQLIVIHDLAYRHLPKGVSLLERAYYSYFMPRFARRADSLLTVSKATRSDVAEAYQIDPTGIRIAYNGVRSKFKRLSPKQVQTVRDVRSDGAPYFVYVGAIHPRKNVDGLIQSFDRFKTVTHRNDKLLIVGNFAWKSGATKDAYEASRFKSDINLTGYLEAHELGEVVGAATALVLVSHFEGFGVPVIEAFTCGVPVLVSDTSSLPEVAGPGGILVNPTDHTAITAGLMRLATEPEARDVLAKAGYEHAKQFTWEKTGKIVSLAIDDLAKERKIF